MTFSTQWDHYWQKPAFYWPLLIAFAAATPLAFAPYYHFWLMPLLFGGLIRLIELRPNRAVRSAYLFGLVAYTCQFYWIHTALHDVSGLPNLFALPLTLLLPACLACFPAAAFWLWSKLQLPRWLSIGLALPILWTLFEFARERVLTGFGWGALGYSQIADNSPLAGFAPLGGIHLVTLCTAFIGAWLVLAVNPEQAKSRLRLSTFAMMLFLLAGGYLLRQIPFTKPDSSSATVALIQGNIPQTLKWNEEQIRPTIQHYYDQVAQTHADLVVLPETAIPMMRQDLPDGVIAQFAKQAQINNSALAIGIAQYTDNHQGYLNAVINLADYHSETPQQIPYYAKNHLVPFGEYIPLPQVTGWLYELMHMPLAGFSRGGTAQAPLIMKNQQVAFNICYEDGFGDELIASAKQSSVLANTSNMAWYDRSNAMFQHAQQSQARALELGRYMVRATNTGFTAIITPQGKIALSASPDTATVLTGQIEGYHGETPYMKTGSSWPLMFILSLIMATLFILNRRYVASKIKIR